MPVHERPLGYVFQEASLFPHLSARRNLEYGMKRVPADARRVAMDQAVELLGIDHLLDRLPERLSGGERQRVAIARALLTSPRLLLIDEPLAELDLARVEFDGGSVWVRDSGYVLDHRVRVRILARDVSIALEPQHESSILNCLPAEVAEIADDAHPALALVQLNVGKSAVVARLTHRSACGLELKPGKPVYVQIKAVALIG